MKIEELGLSTRAYNCLSKAGITTVEELQEKHEDEFVGIRGMGSTTIEEIRMALIKIENNELEAEPVIEPVPEVAEEEVEEVVEEAPTELPVIDEYRQNIGIIKQHLIDAAMDFCAVGYYLKEIRDKEQYKEAGYSTIWECAQAEFGLSKSAASRHMNMNDMYSIGGNSPELDQKYISFNKSQLQEMLSLPESEREKVTPETTVTEIRKLNPNSKASKEPEPVATSQQPVLIKPDEKQREYLNAFARHFIIAERNWFKEDYHNRVVNVLSSPKEIKAHIGYSRVRHFATDKGTAQIKLNDDYVQLCDEMYKEIGCFEWFYLAAAIQSMWNVVAMESARAEAEKKQQQELQKDQEEFLPEPVDNNLPIEAEKCTTETVAISQQAPAEEPETIIDGTFREVVEETPAITQLELPVLKNMDEREQFIRDYSKWPVWTKNELTEETFYRFDLPDGSSIVVRSYPIWNDWRKIDSERCEYYLLKPGYHHFADTETNMTSLKDHLKEVQKNRK